MEAVKNLANYRPAWWPVHEPLRPAVAKAFAATLGVVLFFKRRFLWILLRTFKRDVIGLYRIARVLLYMYSAKLRNLTVTDVFDKTVARYPDKVAFYFNDEKWTFKQVQKLANQTANYFQSLGLKKGDVVAFFMENSPEYPAIWLGFAKLGVIPALINTNLRLDSLKHSITTVNSKALIYGEELSDAVKELVEQGDLPDLPLYSYSRDNSPVKCSKAVVLKKLLEETSSSQPIVKEKFSSLDCIYYIYTSGTTGLPKATIQKHARFFMAVAGAHHMYGITESDVWYTPMPLYHTGAGTLGVGQAILFGTSFVIRKKFSASNYWNDCIRYNVTAIQYIGEICRYLIAQPEKPEEKAHKVRIMVGNGLRREIWKEFMTRFNIRQVAEFYGSSEGNCNMANIDGTVGAVGFVPRLLSSILPYGLVKVDQKTGAILRDPETGLAIQCSVNEPGELVGIIVKNHPIRDFEGYADANAKKDKIAYDIFKKGDSVFRTGDVMVMDELGYYYFQDRSGDTFRWKGENVSTAEVESIVSKILGSKDCTVYGVQIPNTDGRAGMAAIVDDGDIDLDRLCAETKKQLPAYARPLFVRLTKQLNLTGTFKYQKVDMQKEGFDVNKVTDKLYFLQNEKYVPIDKTLYDNLMSGSIRV